MTLEPRAQTISSIKHAFSRFPSGVVALYSKGPEGPEGMVASSFTSVSLIPPLVSISIRNESETWLRMADAPRFGVSIMSTSHKELCRKLAGPRSARFDGVPLDISANGALLLKGAAVAFDCSLFRTIRIGDHLLAVFKIEDIVADTLEIPLVFHEREFKSLTM